LGRNITAAQENPVQITEIQKLLKQNKNIENLGCMVLQNRAISSVEAADDVKAWTMEAEALSVGIYLLGRVKSSFSESLPRKPTAKIVGVLQTQCEFAL
jgi:hypothetical protein